MLTRVVVRKNKIKAVAVAVIVVMMTGVWMVKMMGNDDGNMVVVWGV